MRNNSAAIALVALWMLLAGTTFAYASPTVEELFRRHQWQEMRLSPDGTKIAVRGVVNGKTNLAILERSPAAIRALTSFTSRDVVWFRWINDRRIMFMTGALDVSAEEARGGGMFAVDVDGTSQRLLSEGRDETRGQVSRIMYRFYDPIRFLEDGSDDVIVQEWVWGYETNQSGGLFRLDTRTGKTVNIGVGAPDSGPVESWVVDERGTPRSLVVRDKDRIRIHTRMPPGDKWTLAYDAPGPLPPWLPAAWSARDGKLIVFDRSSQDTVTLRTFDGTAMGETLAAHPRVDLEGLVVVGKEVVGVRYAYEREETAWFREDLERVQRSIDRAMPGTENRILWASNLSRAIVASRSDVSPGAFYLYDREAGTLERLGDRAPWIRPQEMSPTKAVRYVVRDGLEIPAFVTVPRSASGRMPLVLLVHGGPWVRGYGWTFDPEVQFLASRGYAVLAPNFRGSTGLGSRHLVSSFGQWGRSMQDDLEDGVRWAVAEGIADPARVCIVGASYGGYAAMMGLAKTPRLYKCGVNVVGVTDLDLYLTATWTDYAYSHFIAYTARQMVGSPGKLDDVSPVKLADRIVSPVLLVYGGYDRRVPEEHGFAMKSALSRLGKDFEWLYFEGEGHGVRDPKNREAMYGAIERFLARHLKDESAPQFR